MVASDINLHSVLKKYFGYDDFMPGQCEVIQRVVSGDNLLVIMPTGSGKSLCYQLPALILDGIVLVVSPLIALMKDQVDQLNLWNIPSTFINSSITSSEIKTRLNDISEGKYRLVYVAPERFYNRDFTNELKGLKISLFVIDEAHCISEWGHDFRPSYLRLKKVAQYLNARSIIALTATATKEVRLDIRNMLGFDESSEIITGFHRPNLFLMVDRIDAEKKRFERLKKIVTKIQGNIIVYAGTRKVVEKIGSFLVKEGFDTALYHAGLSDEERTKNQDDFINDRKRLIVCTNAFGMGVNKKNVRAVIHFNLPGSLEAYYQEAGRAGRDGKRSFCILLFSAGDRYLQEFFIQGSYPKKELIQEVYSVLDSEGSEMILKTHDEIMKALPSSKRTNEMAISSALRILEENNILERLSERNHKASLKMLYDFDTALEKVDARAEIQRLILGNLIEIYDNDLYNGIQFYADNLALKCGISKESFIRGIQALHEKQVIEYKAPFRGRGIRMSVRNILPDNLPVMYDLLEERAEKEYQRLRQIEGYSYNNELCRHKYLLRYFGEASYRDIHCENCDFCMRPKLKSIDDNHNNQPKQQISGNHGTPAVEPQTNINSIIQKAVLYTVLAYTDRFGAKVIVDILKGSNNASVKKWRLNKAVFYGHFKDLSRDEIDRNISDLVIDGSIIRNKGMYPVLSLSERGKQTLTNLNAAKLDSVKDTCDKPKIDNVELKKLNEKNIVKAVISSGIDNIQAVREKLPAEITDSEIYDALDKLKKEFIESLKSKYLEE